MEGMPTVRLPGFTATDHTFVVPLDHRDPDGEKIEVYGREVRARDGPGACRGWCSCRAGRAEEPPATRPVELARPGGHALHRAAARPARHRPQQPGQPADAGPASARPSAQAAYLAHFRADAIVADCEAIRRELVGAGPTVECARAELRRVLRDDLPVVCARRAGQGAHHRRPAAADGGPDLVYRHTYPNALQRSAAYYARYPEDEPALAAIREHVAANDVRLLNGDRLPAERLQQFGHGFGMVDGFEHCTTSSRRRGPARTSCPTRSCSGIEERTRSPSRRSTRCCTRPCYTQGEAADWSAQRLRAEHPELAPTTRGSTSPAR